jgi:hypothetical protein
LFDVFITNVNTSEAPDASGDSNAFDTPAINADVDA